MFYKIAASFLLKLILNVMHPEIPLLTARQRPSSSRKYPSPEETEGTLCSSNGHHKLDTDNQFYSK
jgi:hypothetical protein